MGDLPPDSRSHNMDFTAAGLARDDQHAPLPSSSPYKTQDNNTPFYSQLSSISQGQHRPDQRLSAQPSPYYPSQQHDSSAFKMGAMAGALPEYGSDTQHQASQSIPRSLSGASTSALVYQLGQNLQMPSHASGNVPVHPSYGPGYATGPYAQGYMPPQSTQSGVYPAYNPNQPRIQGVSPSQNMYQQYPQLSQYMYYPTPYGAPGQYPTSYASQGLQGQTIFGRRASLISAQSGVPGQNVDLSPHEGSYTGARMVPGDPASNAAAFGAPFYQAQALPRSGSVSSIPRGPPRKPKQSGHALWVGNLPPGTTVVSLKDHFSREATKDIESLFLISKSNCAFVNYRTEASCTAAMHRFHDSRFNGVRLVCRLRRSSAPASGVPTGPSAMVGTQQSNASPPTSPKQDGEIVENLQDGFPESPAHQSGDETVVSSTAANKYFIVKSLTLQDLELSIRNGIWATQSHNEDVLNKAYKSAENVYLIFSANKSGEYFGYARMTSPILEDGSDLIGTAPKPENIIDAPDVPKSIPTHATEWAPRGRIIDDSARGTIFWEAELSDSEVEEVTEKVETHVDGDSPFVAQSWGKPFKIEWLSANRLPFYRTRGLRNPWNANREVKIARDGRVKGPASLIRARKKRKLKPLQDVAAATCVSPIAQESEDPDTNGVEDGEKILEYQPSNSDKPLPVHDDSHQDQPSSFPYALRMPEKRVLEFILDVLQRKDTHEIFAEPVDPEEVEDYYEIIKEPMDFATMRAKLHEGMYTSLEQFEHDVFLISENAMHFNSSGTIYFRQARIINELSKRVFHSLKTDPDNFTFEFSETRRRTGRRPQIEVKGSINISNAKPASNFQSNGMTANVSSKIMPYSLSGTAILRRSIQRNPESSGPAFTLTARDNEMLSGATGCRTSFSETDRRSTYIPESSFVNDSYSNVSSIYNPSKTLKHVNQQDMGYRESLMLFVRNLGPTAQMVAKRKLHGRSTEGSIQTSSSNCWFQPPKCHNPPAYASGPQLQTALDNNFGSVMSQNLSHHCHGHHTIPGNSSSRSWIDLCDSDKVGDRMHIFAASVEVEPNGEKKVPLAFKADICTSTAIKDAGFSGSDRVHKSRNNVIMSGSNSSTTVARDLNFSVAGLKDKGSLSETMLSAQSMLDNEAESLKLSSDYSQSELLKFSLRNNHSSTSWHSRTMSISRSPQTNGTMSNLGSQCLIRNDQAIAAQCQSHRVSDLSGASQHLPLASQFTFDLPYLKTRLDHINTSTRDKWLQPTGKSFLDKMSYQKLDNHQQSSLDSKHTDLLLQL